MTKLKAKTLDVIFVIFIHLVDSLSGCKRKLKQLFVEITRNATKIHISLEMGLSAQPFHMFINRKTTPFG